MVLKVKMPQIKITESDLWSRGTDFSLLLAPLRKNLDGGPAWIYKTQQGLQVSLYACEKGASHSHEDLRFSTFNSNFYAAYYETWLPSDLRKPKYWYLEKAYLNIYQLNRSKRTEREYLCLHSDPEETNYKNPDYKRCPHFHIKVAETPIPHAHLALSHGFIDHVMLSHDNIFHVFHQGIELICDEILSVVE